MRARPRCTRRCVGIPSSSWPNSLIEPASAVRSPVIRLNSVVLPAPFGPMIRRRSPGITESDTSLRRRQAAEALVEPRDFERRRVMGRLRRQRSWQAACARLRMRRHSWRSRARARTGMNMITTTKITPSSDVPALDVGRDHVLHQRDDGGADDRAGERAGAAEDRHQQDLGRLLQRDRVRAEEQIVIDVEDARRSTPQKPAMTNVSHWISQTL